MKKILHVSCSPRGQASESYRLAQKLIGFLLQKEPTAILVNRVIGGGAISHVDENYAISQQSSSDISQEGSISLSEELIQELESSDFVVIGTPMHNFTVPSVLKAWIDHIVRVRRTFDVTPGGKVGLLRDRPVFVAVSSGGRFSGERARQPDFLTPYLKAVLGIIGLHDLTFFSVQSTASSPDAAAETRAKTDQALQEYFSSFSSQSVSGAFPPPSSVALPQTSVSLRMANVENGINVPRLTLEEQPANKNSNVQGSFPLVGRLQKRLQ